MMNLNFKQSLESVDYYGQNSSKAFGISDQHNKNISYLNIEEEN